MLFSVIDTAKKQEPDLFDEEMKINIKMLDEAIECEMQFAEDVLQFGIIGLSAKGMRSYLENVADQRLIS